MKKILAPLLAISLLSGTAAIAQSSQSTNQSDNPDRQKTDKQKQAEKQKAAQQRAADRKATQKATQQAARQRTADRKATQQASQQAAQQRAAQQAAQRRADQQAAQRRADQQAAQRRADQQAAQRRADQQAAQRRADQQAAQRRADQLAAQQRAAEAARQHWSRGDRLPDQYRQDRYAVNNWQYYGLQEPPYGYRWHRDDNNDFFLVVIATGMISVPVYWEDRNRQWTRSYHRTYSYDDDIYYRECRTGPDPAGILLGGLIGALIGNSAGHGDRTDATIAGIIIGGTVGAALTSHMDCEDRSYAYKVYSSGFNDGRTGYDYDWRNPNNGHRGTFRVVRYYFDRYGFRCAEFRQSLDYVGRYDRDRNGRACLQPNGAWVVVG